MRHPPPCPYCEALRLAVPLSATDRRAWVSLAALAATCRMPDLLAALARILAASAEARRRAYAREERE